MHMADALISPAVGITMWGASAATIAFCCKKVRVDVEKGIVPLMGVLGAFIFSIQMVNFAIPVTGSSGHLGGGMILAVLLGPYAAFLTIASVLVVQALFFADGGLLALGCNIFNLGFFPAFIAYPLIYKRIAGAAPTPKRISYAIVCAAVIALQLGSFAVVAETAASKISLLPLETFAAIMQPIHLVIGLIEGVVSASVITFVYNARPELLNKTQNFASGDSLQFKKILRLFLVAALLTGGVLSWFASEKPDGLEWAISTVTGQKELKGEQQAVHATVAALQEKIAILPDYSFRKSAVLPTSETKSADLRQNTERNRAGTTLSGIVGSLVTLGVALIIGLALKRRNHPA
jgi:cobalt/nickel transport system permease protein